MRDPGLSADPPWKRCETHGHAIIQVVDHETGEKHSIRVPYQHRHTSMGWGDRPRVQWGEEGQSGIIAAQGEHGLTVMDKDGSFHQLKHGDYQKAVTAGSSMVPEDLEGDDEDEEEDVAHVLMAKAKLKPNQRWITVHPNGKDEKGVPVLLEPAGDGTHRIVGGAGGKLNHLRLHNVKSEGEYKESAKEKAKERQGKEKERKAGQSSEEASDEKQAKEEIKAKKLLAERDFLNKVRSKVGGVDEDLDEDRLRGLSKGAQNLILTRHHKKQLRQAMERKEQLAKSVLDQRVAQAKERATVQRKLHEEAPHVAEAVQELAELEMGLHAQEQRERRAERVQRKSRQTSGQTDVGKKAAEEIGETIAAADPDEDLEALGGRSEEQDGGLSPSSELQRRSLQSMQDAKFLYEAATNGDATGEEARAVIDKALERARLKKTATTEEKEAALMKEAARQVRRSEIQGVRADKLQEMEDDPELGLARAQSALAFSDMIGKITKDASEAKKLGLTESEKTPLQEVEIADIMEVLEDAQELRSAQREFTEMKKAAEDGSDYDRSRRAYTMRVSNSPEEKVVANLEEQIRRELTGRITGIADTKRADHLKAVANGHYQSMADVSLGIAGQRYIDRPTVDALGMANAAVLTRYAMEQDGHKASTVLEALEDHHVGTMNQVTADALAAAESYAPGIEQSVEGVDDIETAMGRLDIHEDAINDAQRAVGAALGRMEGTATLAQAHRQAMPDKLTMDLSESDFSTGLQWAHSIGLKPGDYHLDYTDKKLHIPQKSWGKLITRDSADVLKARSSSNDIKAGKSDEDGWLPEGLVSREMSTFTKAAPSSGTYKTDLDLQPKQAGGLFSMGGPSAASTEKPSAHEVRQQVTDHVGSRLADGERPQDIMSDLLSPNVTRNVADIDAHIDHVKELFPLIDEETGKARKYEDNQEHFQGLSDDYMQQKYGDITGSFHAQDIGSGGKVNEAVYRTLAEHPHGKLAFKPTGQLTATDKHELRNHFHKLMGIDPKVRNASAGYARGFAALGAEPQKEMAGLFGMQRNADWTTWDGKRQELFQKHPRPALADAIASLGPAQEGGQKEHADKVEALREAAAKAPTAWGRYVERHGSLELAQRALQDEIKSDFVKTFQDHHGKLTGQSLKSGITEVTNSERHLQAIATEDEQAELKKTAQSIYARVRERVGGKFAAEGEGAVKGKYTDWLKDEAIARQNQGSFFATKEEDKKVGPKKGERHTIGERAENQLGSMVGAMGEPFEAGKPIGLKFQMNMDGDRIHQQRVIKMMDANGGRVGAWLGTGAGKSATSIGAFTSRHAAGKATHGLYVVPSAVQDQFGGEMVKFTEPGRYRWATGNGKNHDERVAMLKDKGVHMRVMTHQSYRDTTMKLMQDHHGLSRKELQTKLRGADHNEQANMLREAMDAHGIPKHFTYWDEAHMGTHRDGTDPSGTNLILRATTHPTNSAGGMMLGTATPHKNDTSEVYSMASTLDPERYSDKHAFMQAFGHDIHHAPDAIRRELSHLTYSAKIPPQGVDRLDSNNPAVVDGKKVGQGGSIKLGEEHQARVDRVHSLYKRAQSARHAGVADVEAMKELSPARFAAAPEHEHDRVAKDLQKSLGIIRESALRRAINQAPPEINTKLQRLTKVVKHDLEHGEWTHRKTGETKKGKPSVVFTDSLAEARMIHKHLKGQGVSAALYHGGLNSKEREKVRRGFQPESGEPTHNVVVMTSAGEAGINMQRAKVIHHFDVPMTEKSHNQRSGRAYRQGQQGDVDVHNWHTDTDFEQRALRRLKKKAGLASVFQTPLGNLDESGIASAYHRAKSAQHQGADVGELAAK